MIPTTFCFLICLLNAALVRQLITGDRVPKAERIVICEGGAPSYPCFRDLSLLRGVQLCLIKCGGEVERPLFTYPVHPDTSLTSTGGPWTGGKGTTRSDHGSDARDLLEVGRSDNLNKELLSTNFRFGQYEIHSRSPYVERSAGSQRVCHLIGKRSESTALRGVPCGEGGVRSLFNEPDWQRCASSGFKLRWSDGSRYGQAADYFKRTTSMEIDDPRVYALACSVSNDRTKSAKQLRYGSMRAPYSGYAHTIGSLYVGGLNSFAPYSYERKGASYLDDCGSITCGWEEKALEWVHYDHCKCVLS
jgi:hypothetical protein